MAQTFILTAQTSTNVALTIETILTRFEGGRGAEWRHVWKIKREKLRNHNSKTISFDGTNQHKRSTNDWDYFDEIWAWTGGWVTSHARKCNFELLKILTSTNDNFYGTNQHKPSTNEQQCHFNILNETGGQLHTGILLLCGDHFPRSDNNFWTRPC